MKKSLGLVALIALVVAVGVVAAPAPAFAAGTGTVVIQLVKPSGSAAPISGLFEDIYYLHNGTVAYSHGTNSNSTGVVTFTNVPAVSNLILTTAGNSTYLATKKTGVKLGSGKTVHLNVKKPVGASIQGTLTKTGGSAVVGATVAVFTKHGKLVGDATTSVTGGYQVTPLATGKYRVQFNSRVEGSDTGPASGYNWSYWKNTTSWSSSKSVSVTQQTSKAPASHLNNINGSVAQKFVLTADVEFSGSQSNADVEIVSQHSAEDFSSKVNAAGTSFQLYLNTGKYRIAILGAFDPIMGQEPVYWYRADNKGPTEDENKATWISFGTGNKTIKFEDAPILF